MSREVNGDAEMDVATQFFKGLRYKGEERHQVVEGEECGVGEGLFLKWEMMLKCRWRGDSREKEMMR